MTYEIFIGAWSILCAGVLCVAIVVAYDNINNS